ncbi:hypothetical protein [Streptomyces erythrochromogenes]|uniref:hypothetical protein n=1 Tax=Streptomyces erythrochromogenes TaxID=285574 RepID=UPI00225492DB|nr:hypothetical protein [Streptomyces erythrochromogenes]MCX5586035.1 hypothetical protein [Streptomyces erythrochromogenes]
MTLTEDVLAYMTLALQVADPERELPDEEQLLVGQAALDLLEREPLDAMATITGIAFGLLRDLSHLTGRTREELWQEVALNYAETEGAT